MFKLAEVFAGKMIRIANVKSERCVIMNLTWRFPNPIRIQMTEQAEHFLSYYGEWPGHTKNSWYHCTETELTRRQSSQCFMWGSIRILFLLCLAKQKGNWYLNRWKGIYQSGTGARLKILRWLDLRKFPNPGKEEIFKNFSWEKFLEIRSGGLVIL